MKAYNIILSPVVTEKAIDQLEKENKLTFEIRAGVSKAEVAKAVEELYGVKVVQVNTHNTMGRPRKAVVRLSPSTSASDVAAKLGIV